MYNGWFYYRDVYRSPTGFYYDVPEKEADTFSPPEDWELLQVFDEKIADTVCEKISLQFENAFEWLLKFEQENQKKNISKYVIRKKAYKALNLLFKKKK